MQLSLAMWPDRLDEENEVGRERFAQVHTTYKLGVSDGEKNVLERASG